MNLQPKPLSGKFRPSSGAPTPSRRDVFCRIVRSPPRNISTLSLYRPRYVSDCRGSSCASSWLLLSRQNDPRIKDHLQHCVTSNSSHLCHPSAPRTNDRPLATTDRARALQVRHSSPPLSYVDVSTSFSISRTVSAAIGI